MPLSTGVPGCCDCSVPLTVTVHSACGGLISGALVETLDGGGGVIDSCTTNGSGVCTLNSAGAATLRVSASRHTTYSSAVTSSVTLAVDSTDYICCVSCDQPIPKVLNASDLFGSFTLTLTSVPFLEWTACRDLTASAINACDPMTNFCVPGGGSGSGTVPVSYNLSCNGGFGTLSLQVGYPQCTDNVLVAVFPMGGTCALPPTGVCGGFFKQPPKTSLSCSPLVLTYQMPAGPYGGASSTFIYTGGEVITITE